MAKSTPTTPAPSERDNSEYLSRICSLVQQWKIEKTKMDLALLENDGVDEGADRILHEARAKMQDVEEAILSTETDDFSDHDLMFMLRLARQIIGDHQFTPEQEQRAEAMLELLDTALLGRRGRWRSTL